MAFGLDGGTGLLRGRHTGPRFDETVDLGDRVFVLFHDFARLKGTNEELHQEPANIWTVRDGKIARAEFYVDWSHALRAFGFEE